MDNKIAVIIPTYNEYDNIAYLIQKINTLLPRIHILIIDDNSPDGTGIIAQRLSEMSSTVDVIHRVKKLGLASAYKEGFIWALARDFDYIIQMDADFSHRPEDILRLLEAIQCSADLVIGSRYKKGLRVKGWAIFRILLSYSANVYSRVILKTSIWDMTSGFRCYRAGILKTIDLSMIHSEGYAFQIEMAYLFHQNKFVIEEIPIVFIERKKGKTKLDLIIIVEAFLTVLRLRWRRKNIKFH